MVKLDDKWGSPSLAPHESPSKSISGDPAPPWEHGQVRRASGGRSRELLGRCAEGGDLAIRGEAAVKRCWLRVGGEAIALSYGGDSVDVKVVKMLFGS